MKKKVFLLPFVMLLAAICLVGLVSCNSEESILSDGFLYTDVGDGTCAVVLVGPFSDTDIVIPSVSPVGDRVTDIRGLSYDQSAEIDSDSLASLTSIRIPDSAMSISRGAFDGCSGLTSITIPKGVISIDHDAFGDCTSLVSITVAEENPTYHSAGNCIIKTKTDTLVIGCKASVIPDDGSVTVIGPDAFYCCTSLTDITIPDGVISIDDYAFYGCSNLKSIAISDSVTSIGKGAFRECAGLTAITIPEGVTSIDDSVFSSCDSLTSMTVAEGNPRYRSAGNCIIELASGMVIAGCKSSVIPDDGSVTGIDSWAFVGLTSFESIMIPACITDIDPWAFSGCDNLTIRVQATSKPSGWNEHWNSDNCHVVWGYKPA